MKTKANTLIEDGQDIKVKNILFEDNNISIKRLSNGNIQIENKVEGIILKDAYGNELIINDEGYKIYAGGEETLGIDGSIAVFSVPVILFNLPSHTSIASPYEGNVVYNSTLKKCVLYNGTAWVNLDGTALA